MLSYTYREEKNITIIKFIIWQKKIKIKDNDKFLK